MTIQDQVIAKLRQMPEPLVQEVNDFIDLLMTKQDAGQQQWLQPGESLEIAESDFSSYLTNLEDYEDRLAHGEIQW